MLMELFHSMHNIVFTGIQNIHENDANVGREKNYEIRLGSTGKKITKRESSRICSATICKAGRSSCHL